VFNSELEEFEALLKSFRPLTPSPLSRQLRPSKAQVVMALVACASVALLFMAISLRHAGTRLLENNDSQNNRKQPLAVPREHLSDSTPFTIGTASRLLVAAPSFEVALNMATVRVKSTVVAANETSAITLLKAEVLER
jgi:hypothetical protein